MVDESRTSCRGYAPVRKSTFSSKMRLLYTVGLEHTGHHLWHQAIFPKVQLALSLIPTLTYPITLTPNPNPNPNPILTLILTLTLTLVLTLTLTLTLILTLILTLTPTLTQPEP